MTRKYPNMFNIRLTCKDKKQIEAASIQEDIPPSTLARKILRQWLRANDLANSEKSHPQLVNPPAAKKAC